MLGTETLTRAEVTLPVHSTWVAPEQNVLGERRQSHTCLVPQCHWEGMLWPVEPWCLGLGVSDLLGVLLLGQAVILQTMCWGARHCEDCPPAHPSLGVAAFCRNSEQAARCAVTGPGSTTLVAADVLWVPGEQTQRSLSLTSWSPCYPWHSRGWESTEDFPAQPLHEALSRSCLPCHLCLP